MSSDSAYERVTNPERFAALHEAARELVDDLRQRFDVLVEATAPEADNLPGIVLSAVRVSPRNDGAAVTITLTDFPGLCVRFGSEHAETFPQCGCDACDEQPDQLAENLREKLESVAYGRFSEPAGGYDFVFDAGRESGGQSVRRFGRKPPTRHYDPWPPLVSGERLPSQRWRGQIAEPAPPVKRLGAWVRKGQPG